MPLDDRYVPSGWLHKSARFNLMHSLKLRYFVLLDTELRYYKHPDDTHPAGIVELKNFHDIEEHSSHALFGFKLVSETKGQWIPMLYAETNQERQLWMERIKANLNRLSNCNHYCSPSFCSFDSHHRPAETNKTNSIYHSVLDRWLDKLDLYDGSDNDADYFSKQGSDTASSSPDHSRSNSVAGNSSLSSKHKSTGSISTLEYNSSIYSEPSTFVSSSNSSGYSHISTKRQHSTPVKGHHGNQHLRHNSNPAFSGHHSNNSHNSMSANNGNSMMKQNINSKQKKSPSSTIIPTPKNSTKSSSSAQLSHILSIESERVKYTETTLQYFQHPHIHRSSNTKFHSELGISLSPPPPRR